MRISEGLMIDYRAQSFFLGTRLHYSISASISLRKIFNSLMATGKERERKNYQPLLLSSRFYEREER